MRVPQTLRGFAESKRFCGLTLSPLMAAVMDASDGVQPTTIDDEAAIAHFGCALADLPRAAKRTVAVRAGGRSGKTSRMLAVKALLAAWTVEAPTLRRGEYLSSLLIGPDLKLGRQALSFVTGYVEDSPTLTRALLEPPTKDAIELRRPDGKKVRIEVLAASRGGRAVRGRTLAFAGLDEAAFFYDETTGVVNDSDIFRAVLQRVVPGGQVWIVSTPWLADVGLLETTVAQNWGTHATALVVTSGTRALNPTWDPTGEIETDLRATDPDAAIREIDGEPQAGGAGTVFDPAAIAMCKDDDLHLPVPTGAGKRAHFGADLAFVGDSSAIVGVAKVGDKYEVLYIDEKRPAKGSPLKPKVVVDAFADVLHSYGAREFVADGHYRESAKEHLEPHAIKFVDAPAGREGKYEVYMHARKLLHEGRVRMPNHARLIAQLRTVTQRPVAGGGFAISSPRRKGSGHGDIASAFVLALWRASREAKRSGGYHPTPEERAVGLAAARGVLVDDLSAAY